MAGGMEYSQHKLQELILYVSARSLSDRRYGMTKLNKILFFSDFGAFRQLGQSITGAEYQHLPQGPCPHQLVPALNALGDDIREIPEQTPVGTQRRLVPLREPNLSVFTGAEIAVVESVLSELRPLTNKQVSDLSHDTMAWRLTDLKQEIPYGMALLSSDEPTLEDLEWLERSVHNAEVGAQPR